MSLLFVLACSPGPDSASEHGDSASGNDTAEPSEPVVDFGGTVLVVGPASGEPGAVAAALQALVDGDAVDGDVEVTGVELPGPATPYVRELSLMSAWYQHTDRDERLASLDGDWDHVVLIEAEGVVARWPELTFEGLATLGQHFEDRGSRVHLLLEHATELETVAEHAARVAAGTGTELVPAGLVVEGLGTDWELAAAASLYASLGGVSLGLAAEPAGQDDWAGVVETVDAVVEAGVAFEGPWAGAVRVDERTLPDSYGAMIAGTSSENGYLQQLRLFLDERGLAHHDASLGQCNDYREVTVACLEVAEGIFGDADFVTLFARGYDVDHDEVVAAGGGEVQAQVYDRHWDATDDDGHDALDELEARLVGKIDEANDRGLALIPHHAFWARLHDLRPDGGLLRDGVHATEDVQYGLATMSFVAATGQDADVDGLADERTELVALAQDLVWEWSSLQER